MAMKMAVMSMEMTPGAIPRPGRVPEQRLLSPELEFRDGGGSGRFSRVSSIGFEVLGQGGLNRRRGGVGGATGPPHTRGAPPWDAPPPRVGPPGPPSGPPLTFWMVPGKIRCWALTSSDSENISFVGFLKPKTAENSNWPFGISSIG